MYSANAMNASFENLAIDPQQGKRKRNGSLPRNSANHATLEEDADEYFSQQPKSDEEFHNAKRGRSNNAGDEMDVDESQAVANFDIASALQNIDLRKHLLPAIR